MSLKRSMFADFREHTHTRTNNLQLTRELPMAKKNVTLDVTGPDLSATDTPTWQSYL